MIDLVSMGECMVEFFTEEPSDSAVHFTRAVGGDAFNLLAAAQRLGSTTAFVTRAADDAFGRYLHASWAASGVDLRYVRRDDSFNGAYFIATGVEGQREFTYYRKGSAAGRISCSDLDAIDFGGLRAFHTSGITQALSETSRNAAVEGLRRARIAGAATSFDLNYRPRLWGRDVAREALLQVLPFVNYLFAGVPEDTGPLLGTENVEDAARLLHDAGAQVVVLKAGAQGAWISDGNGLTPIPARIYGPAVDTTGAGDAFAGGFLHGVLSGMDLKQAGAIGSICAGLKVLGRGAVASMPTGEEVFRRLAAESLE